MSEAVVKRRLAIRAAVGRVVLKEDALVAFEGCRVPFEAHMVEARAHEEIEVCDVCEVMATCQQWYCNVNMAAV